ncbi:BrnT family toxin [Aequoribacter fuscus]|nr:BrnT family toxin [Aequoribacter fuscus]
MNYSLSMEFQWDKRKSDKCFIERGFDFAYAAYVFADSDRIVQKDERFNYGEERYEVIGCIEGRLFVVVFTPRGQSIRLISARKANQKEVKRYEERKNDD